MKRFVALAVSLLALGACTTVGPDYRSPEAQAPAQAPFAGAGSPAFSGEQPNGAWWSLFADPVLDGLVRDALAAQGGEAAALADNPILFPDDATRRRLYFWGGLDAAAEDRLQARFESITS